MGGVTLTPAEYPTSYSPGEVQKLIGDTVVEQRARDEARRIIEAEREHVEDLDGLYLDRDALDHLPAPDPLIPTVLPRHAYGILRGRDQSYKSFVALDWALCLATGQPWQFMPVARVPVLYIAGEGAWGLRQRVATWEVARRVRVEQGWFRVRQAALNMHRPGPAFDHLLEHVTAGGYGLVVVDTLRRVSGAADGNGSEMGLVVDSLDRLKHATTDGSVLVVTHTDKGDNDSRGYSGIEDDADFVWHARRDSHRLELELTKMKDGPDSVTYHLQASPVQVAPGEQSLVLTAALPKATHDEANESEAKLLATLRTVFPEGTYSGALHEASGLTKPTYHRALAALKARGQVLDEGSAKRPFYVAAGGLTAPPAADPPGLTGSAVVSPLDSPSDLRRSHQVSMTSQEVSQVSRPLGSETMRPETCECGVPKGASLPHLPGCPTAAEAS